MADSERSEHVTTSTTTTGGGSGMGFVLGALVVVVAGLAYFIFAGDSGTGSDSVNITVEGAGDAAEGAAEAVSGAVESN